MVDLRHELVFTYIVFAFLWFAMLSPLLVSAQMESTSGNYSIAANTSFNNSSWDAGQVTVGWNLLDFLGKLVSFHFDFWYIDLFIVTIGIVLIGYSGLTMITPGG